MPPAIVVEHLTVHRGGRPVLHDVSCTVPSGSITGLIGPSGGGKTTLIRSIVGVQRLQAGSVMVLGLPGGAAPLRRRVGYVTQEPAIYPDLTVRGNVRYFAALSRVGRAAAEAALEQVELVPQAGQLAGSLSGGQQARLSLATALLARPEVLLLDEPTVGLDPVLRRELWNQFQGLAAQGVTLLISSHVMDEASRCHRLLLLREGRILADDTPEALLARTGTADLDAAFLELIAAEERRG
jgi:ABC-2 type transport system ATP-binding protein